MKGMFVPLELTYKARVTLLIVVHFTQLVNQSYFLDLLVQILTYPGHGNPQRLESRATVLILISDDLQE